MLENRNTIRFIKSILKDITAFKKQWKILYKEAQRLKEYTYLPDSKQGQLIAFYRNHPSFGNIVYYSHNVTYLHILYNQLRNKKPHTKEDEKYVNSETYKAIFERIQSSLTLLEANHE